MIEDSDDIGCGLATKSDGSQQIVVAHRYNIEVYDLGSGAWRCVMWTTDIVNLLNYQEQFK